MDKLEKTQSNLLKAGLKLKKLCRSTPILNAIEIPEVREVIECQTLSLTRRIFDNSSRARTYYIHILNQHLNNTDVTFKTNDLISRTISICTERGHSVLDLIFNKTIKTNRQHSYEQNGLTDTIKIYYIEMKEI